jgi:CRP/FNR family transcriptional regulator, cyclic AMP receptor protein
MNDTLADSISCLLHERQVGAKRESFSEGQIIYRPADLANHFFILESGIVHVFSARQAVDKRLLDILGPKQCFGFAALANLTAYGLQTESVGNTVVQVVDAVSLRQAIASHGNTTMQLVESLARRLYVAWIDERESASTDCRSRIIKALLHFQYSPVAQPVPGGIELHITHAQLAEAVGIARETVTMCLIQMRQENLVQTGRNRLIYDPQVLIGIGPQAASVLNSAIAI